MYIYTQPESPRWLLGKADKASKARQSKKAERYYEAAFQSLIKLRHSKLQAARDMLLIHYSLRKEEELFDRGSQWAQKVLDLFRIRRNRRAVVASLIVMFFQQFCGINVLIYYSTTVLLEANYTPRQALFVSESSRAPSDHTKPNMLIAFLLLSGLWALALSTSYLLYPRSERSTPSVGETCCPSRFLSWRRFNCSTLLHSGYLLVLDREVSPSLGYIFSALRIALGKARYRL